MLSKIVKEIYDIEVPSDGTAKTTYNVGTISGGTSVNTIAQYAEILCEYRSERNDYLEIMQSKFNEIFEKYNTGSVSVTVEKVGDRPCGRPEDTVINEYLCDCYKRAVSGIVSGEIDAAVASTDCNVPLSLSIPAIAIGVFNGKGAHTKEKSSMPVGLTVGLRFTLDLTSK